MPDDQLGPPSNHSGLVKVTDGSGCTKFTQIKPPLKSHVSGESLSHSYRSSAKLLVSWRAASVVTLQNLDPLRPGQTDDTRDNANKPDCLKVFQLQISPLLDRLLAKQDNERAERVSFTLYAESKRRFMGEFTLGRDKQALKPIHKHVSVSNIYEGNQVPSVWHPCIYMKKNSYFMFGCTHTIHIHTPCFCCLFFSPFALRTPGRRSLVLRPGAVNWLIIGSGDCSVTPRRKSRFKKEHPDDPRRYDSKRTPKNEIINRIPNSNRGY